MRIEGCYCARESLLPNPAFLQVLDIVNQDPDPGFAVAGKLQRVLRAAGFPEVS
jgi:hypothetical protein